MLKKAELMKALIAKSGKQVNNFSISKEAIKTMHSEHNEGKLLIDKINYTDTVPCGWLVRTELQTNKDTDELELWGYFMYTPGEKPFKEDDICSYEISYCSEDMDDDKVLHECSLNCCIMFDKEK